VNVKIVKSSAGKVLRTFANCLQSLPNLHTLQIASVNGNLATAIKTAFNGRRFLKIHTITLPVIAHHILRSCPQVRNVACTHWVEKYFINTVAQKCKKVEALDVVVLLNDTVDRESFTKLYL
jgi:hypothetical protein